jgi:hypothetical protein
LWRTLLDANDLHGDVVVAAALVGEFDELLAGGLGLRRGDDLTDLLRAEQPVQAVGAQQEDVALSELEWKQVHEHVRLLAQAAQQHAAVLRRLGLFRGELAHFDLQGDPRVIASDLLDLAVAHQVGAAVANVGHIGAVAMHGGADDGGAHAEVLDVLLGGFVDRTVGLFDGFAQALGERAVVLFIELAHDLFDSHLAGHIAGAVAAHAVGHEEQGDAVVSVGLA